MSQNDSARPKTAIVVGAGVAGTALAARLSHAGLKVTVVEKNGFTGGRCSLIHTKEGFRFDRGPSLLLLPKLFAETFEDLGSSLDQENIKLFQCDPNYVVHFGDGQQMTLSSNLTSLKSEVERFEGVDGFEGFLSFLQEAHRHYELSVEHVLHRNFTSLLSMLRWGFLSKVFTLHPFTSIYSRASRYFKTDRLRRAFTFSSMYMGMSPMDAPATYSLLQYTEIAEGIWYPEGGFHRIVQGLESIAKRQGVRIRLDSPVKSVIVEDESAKGVELLDGERLKADIVCINADLVYAYNNLLPSSRYAESLASRQSSCSSISFYWSLSQQVPQLNAHNIFLADHYKESFDSIFKAHKLPEEPSFYVNVPSRIDATAAPAGRDAIVILVPVGHLTPGQDAADVNSMVATARRQIIQTLEARLGIEDFQSLITDEFVNDPVSWKEDFNLDKGSILGLSHSFFNVLSFRPKTKHSSIKNCYFAGASAHPGTGVPIVLAGAKMTAEQVLSDHGIQLPWAKWQRKPLAQSFALDRVHAATLSASFLLVVLSALAMLVLALYLQTGSIWLHSR